MSPLHPCWGQQIPQLGRHTDQVCILYRCQLRLKAETVLQGSFDRVKARLKMIPADQNFYNGYDISSDRLI